MNSLHEDIAPGTGLTAPVREAALVVLRAVIPGMFHSQQPWALMGSLASVLQGIPDYEPPDIDLATTVDGAYVMQERIMTVGSTLRPLALSSSGPYTSHFGIFDVGGVKVEVMGDLVIRCEDGAVELSDHWSRWSDKVRVLHFEDIHVPVIPLEWQIVANALLRRPERVDSIATFLARHGYDARYLDTILSDRKYGERTLSIVREALHLEC
jgi:hypothetical protein